MFEEISDSEEETSLNKSSLVNLLLQLENDLKKSHKSLHNFSCDLKELKKIATLPVISINNITWFLESTTFNLMRETPKEFSISPIALYECMLERTGNSCEEDYLKHNKQLLELKNKENAKLSSLLSLRKELDKKIKTEIKIKEQNPVRAFFHALSTRKSSLKESNTSPIPSKRIKLQAISPLALPSNSIPKEVDRENTECLLPARMQLC
jgi:hypothetical protein